MVGHFRLLSNCPPQPSHTPGRSLLEDGSDAVTFGLSQRSTSSAHEWWKRVGAGAELAGAGLMHLKPGFTALPAVHSTPSPNLSGQGPTLAA